MAALSKGVFGIFFLIGSIFASGFYLAAFHFYPSLSMVFLVLTIGLAILGVVKSLNDFSDSLPLKVQKAIRWIHSMVFEGFSVLITFFMRPIGYLTNQGISSGASDGRPILLIHGYLHDSSAWMFFKRELGRLGFGPIYTLNLTHPFRSIRDYAAQVAEKSEEIRQKTGRDDLVLIGHSMGGLVSSWYAAKLAPEDKVLDVITIGSPLNGTHVAKIALGPNGKEMRPGSPLIEDLQQEIANNRRIHFYHIASKVDQLIFPHGSALIGMHPEKEYLVEDIGHMTLLFSPRVVDKVAEWIRT